MPVKKIQFPAMEPAELAKLTKFLETTGQFMEVGIRVVEVTTVTAIVDAERADVVTILNKVAANEKIKQKKSEEAAKTPKKE
jgi:hypothetical protein